MQAFDAIIKRLVQQFGEETLERLTGSRIARWLPTELPKIQNLRVDLLGETEDGGLMQLEVQSTNDSALPMRMLEYTVAIARMHGQFPHQVVLYVGREPLRMRDRIEWVDGSARFTMIEIREVDAQPLLGSNKPSDNVIGVLARLSNEREAVRAIVTRLAGLSRDDAAFYLRALLVLAGLRGLEEAVQEEARTMAFTVDITENKVLGPVYARGLQEGRQEGRQEGELALLRRQLERRFGPLPGWAEETLSGRSADQIGELGLRLLDAASLEDLFRA